MQISRVIKRATDAESRKGGRVSGYSIRKYSGHGHEGSEKN